jgi:hypothetical protein
MDDRRQVALGMADQLEQTLDPRELEIDDLRMEPHDALQHEVALGVLRHSLVPNAVMVVLGTTIHEFACDSQTLPSETRGWSDQVRP